MYSSELSSYFLYTFTRLYRLSRVAGPGDTGTGFLSQGAVGACPPQAVHPSQKIWFEKNKKNYHQKEICIQ